MSPLYLTFITSTGLTQNRPPQSELTRKRKQFFDGDVTLGTSEEEKLFAVEVSRSGSGELCVSPVNHLY